MFLALSRTTTWTELLGIAQAQAFPQIRSLSLDPNVSLEIACMKHDLL